MIDRSYSPSDLLPLIDWPHFLFAWGFKGAAMSSQKAEDLKAEALTALSKMEQQGAHTQARAMVVDAAREGDDLLLYRSDTTLRIPCLRQQQCDKGSEVCRCLADYLAPVGKSHPIGNRLGVFATATHAPQLEQELGAYQKMMLQTLADRLAEAAAEKLHREVLNAEWETPQSEPLIGIRPAVGYPSLPDMSINFLLDTVLHFKNLNITLTESGMMIPHAAVSGLIFAHPKAVYFNVGPISEEQFLDYAQRRNVTAEWLQKFLHYSQ